MNRRFDPVTGKVVPVFFHYAIPSVIGMLAATSAGIIDGIFIGNYVGAPALAAVNIALPVFYLFAAVVFMLAVGGSVMCGKFLGENNLQAAREIFTRTLIASLVVALLIVGSSLLFLDQVVAMLGANEDLHGMVRDYMQIIGAGISVIFVFFPVTLISVFLGSGESATEMIALAFIAVFWPAFLFNGANIALASYFTALHKPLQSAAIAVSRSLALPVIGLLLLPIWFGDTGIFITIPIAEALTFLLALGLMVINRPTRIVAEIR